MEEPAEQRRYPEEGTAKRFIRIFSKAELIDQFDVDLYFKLVEKISVYDSGVLVVSLLDGSGIECVIE